MNTTFRIEVISKAVCNYFQISEKELFEFSRKKESPLRRHLFFYFCREFTKESFPKIGKYANRDHATVIHSVNKILVEREIYQDIKKHIEGITNMLFGTIIVRDVNLLLICENYSKSFI